MAYSLSSEAFAVVFAPLLPQTTIILVKLQHSAMAAGRLFGHLISLATQSGEHTDVIHYAGNRYGQMGPLS